MKNRDPPTQRKFQYRADVRRTSLESRAVQIAVVALNESACRRRGASGIGGGEAGENGHGSVRRHPENGTLASSLVLVSLRARGAVEVPVGRLNQRVQAVPFVLTIHAVQRHIGSVWQDLENRNLGRSVQRPIIRLYERGARVAPLLVDEAVEYRHRSRRCHPENGTLVRGSSLSGGAVQVPVRIDNQRASGIRAIVPCGE